MNTKDTHSISNWISKIILFLFVQIQVFSLSGQNIVIYKGDSVFLPLPPYRGEFIWQEANNDGQQQNPTWYDISNSNNKSLWQSPIIHKQYRGKVTEASCFPTTYTNVQTVLISSQTGLEIYTDTPSSITANSLISGGKFIRLGGNSQVIKKGLMWDTISNLKRNFVEDSIGESNFVYKIEGLLPEKTYYITAYYKDLNGITIYKNTLPAKTLASHYVTIKSPVAEVSYTSAKLEATIQANSLDSIIQRGFCWMSQYEVGSNGLNPDLTNHVTICGTGAGSFDTTLQNLENNTNYYFRAFCKLQSGEIIYSKIYLNNLWSPITGTFKTKIALKPILEGITELSKNTAVFGMQINGDGVYTAFGVCYGTTVNPDTNSLIVLKTTGTFTGARSYGGILLQSLSSNTNYYLRAYLINDAGNITYSDQISFKTLLPNQYPISIELYQPVLDGNKVQFDAKLNGFPSGFGGNPIIVNKGFSYASNVFSKGYFSLNLNDSLIWLGSSITDFSANPSNISIPDFYYVRPFIQLSGGTTIWGYSRSFFYYNFSTINTLIKNITNITSTSSSISHFSEVLPNTGSGTIFANGVCYSTKPNVSFDDERQVGTNQPGDQAVNLNNLQPNTTYYVRAYSTINAYGSGYHTYLSDEFSFTTLSSQNISVGDVSVNNISSQGIVAESSITGSGEVSYRGFCWNTAGNPTVSDNIVVESKGTGTFNLSISSLNPGTTYFIRAYTKPKTGARIYGNIVTFTTADLPVSLNTLDVTNIGTTSALTQTNLELLENIQIQAKGVCYGTSTMPLVTGTKTIEGTAATNFFSTISGLTQGTNYYARAYVTEQSGATHYGNEVYFTTNISASFEVNTTPIANLIVSIQSYDGTVGGSVSGGGTISARGICYGLNPNPVISGTKLVLGSGMGSFSGSLVNLLFGTTYYYRAYATNSAGLTVYGPQFTISQPNAISTTTISNITATSASCGGSIPGSKSGTVTARGVCWSTSALPTIANSKTVDGNGSGSFTSNITGLVINTSYFVRAYATLSTGITYYGDEKRLTTYQQGVLSVSTNSITNITEATVNAFGSVIGKGTITARGFCIGTNINPTITSNTTITVYTWDSSAFNSQLNALNASTTYYVRAFATESGSTTFYGNNQSFTTLPAPNFTVTTLVPTPANSMNPICGGTISGNGIVAERGVCFSVNANPEAYANSLTREMGNGMGSFQEEIDLIMPGATIYMRAYAKTSGGTYFYGNNISYATSKIFTFTQNPIEVFGVTAKVGGGVSLFAGATISVKGICYDTSANPTILNAKTTNGNTNGPFTVILSGLLVNTSYYYRTYATDLQGTTYYGPIKYFLTRDHASIFVESRGSFDKTITTIQVGGQIDNIGNETVVSRGVCYSKNINPTTADTKTIDGSGNGIFISYMSGLSASTAYYFRAYAITNTNKTVYGKVVMVSTNAYEQINPPVPVPQPMPPPNKGGGSGGSGGGVVGGKRYLIFGKVSGPAKLNCQEGWNTFTDYKARIYSIIEEEFSYESYQRSRNQLESQMKASYNGTGYIYSLENSNEKCKECRWAVIIEYNKKIPGWNCHSLCVTIGYGTSEQDALNNAVKRKNNDINGAARATYKKLQTINW